MARDLRSLIVLFKAHRFVFNNVKKTMEGEPFSLNEFAAMEALFHKGDLTTQELIDSVLIPNSSMTYVLDSLAKKELITRTKNANDKRIIIVKLTDKGKTLFDGMYDRHEEKMRKIFDVLTPEEEAELTELLKKLGMAAEENLKEE